MKVTVDLELCQGHGQCEDAAPEVFEVGDDAFAHVKVACPAPDLRPGIEDAIRRCPTEAIRLEEG